MSVLARRDLSPREADARPAPHCARAGTAPAPEREGPGPSRLGWYAPAKVAIDFAAALTLLVLTAPLLLLAVVLVKLTSRGPAFYSQVRLGLNGRPFWIWKVRTMVHNCELHSGVQWATARDPRVTPVGRFLRLSHLDELPQLWNVLWGDMSLIGPRPERPEIVAALDQAIPHYRGRLLVRPGLGGLAQAQLPPDTDVASVRRKLAYDLYYVRHAGFWLDLKLMLATFCYVIHLPTALTCRLLGVPTGAVVEQPYRAWLKLGAQAGTAGWQAAAAAAGAREEANRAANEVDLSQMADDALRVLGQSGHYPAEIELLLRYHPPRLGPA